MYSYVPIKMNSLPIFFEVNELIADDEASISGSSANFLPQQVLVEGVESGFIVMRLILKLFIIIYCLTLWLSRMMILMVIWIGIPIW